MGFSPAGGDISGADDVALSNPANNQVLTYDGTIAKWKNAAASATPRGSQAFTYSGNISVGTGIMPLYNDSGVNRTITSVRASVGTAPTGSSAIIDINVGGTTIFPTQSQRPTIAAAQTTSGAVSRSAAWANGQPLTIDIDQVGSSTTGANLVVTVEYQ